MRTRNIPSDVRVLPPDVALRLTLISQTYFHGSKGVRAIVVLLFMVIIYITDEWPMTKSRSYERLKYKNIVFKLIGVVLLFYVHGKHLRSGRDGQLTYPHFSCVGSG